MSKAIDRGAVRQRMLLFAHERNLDPDMIVPKRLSDDAVISFCHDHGASFDWIIRGDLRGRLRQARYGRGWQLAEVQARKAD